MISSTSSNTAVPQAGAAQITQPQPVVTRQMSTVAQPAPVSSMVVNLQQQTIETGRESSSEEAMRLRGGGCCTGFLRIFLCCCIAEAVCCCALEDCIGDC